MEGSKPDTHIAVKKMGKAVRIPGAMISGSHTRGSWPRHLGDL